MSSSSPSRPGTEPLLMAGVAVLGVAVVAVVQPRWPELLPACPSRTLFGVWCPLCGGTRATAALGRGDVPASLAYNPLLLPFAVAAAWSWAGWMQRCRSGARRLVAIPRQLWWTLGVAAVVLGVLRNVPALSILAPG